MSQLILIALWRISAMGCDRQSDAPAQPRKAQFESHEVTLPVRNNAPPDPPAKPGAVAVPQGAAPHSEKAQNFRLPLYEFRMDPQDLRAMERNPRSDDTRPAVFIADGDVHNRLQDRFFSEPALRARFLDRLAELLEKEFTTAKLFPVLDRLESDIGPEAALDRRRWPGPGEDLHSGIAGVKSYIGRRRAYLQRELKQLRPARPAR